MEDRFSGREPPEAPNPPGDGAMLVIHDSRAARELLEPTRSRLLKPFLAAPCTVAEAADRTGLPLQTMFDRVRRFVDLGLVEIVGERPRRGRPQKLYAATSSRFFLPYRVSGYATFEEFLQAFERAWTRPLSRGLAEAHAAQTDAEAIGLGIAYQDGFLLYDIGGSPDTVFQPRPARGIGTLWDTRLHLSDDDVERLTDELGAVLERYLQRSSGPRRVLRFAIAPWRE